MRGVERNLVKGRSCLKGLNSPPPLPQSIEDLIKEEEHLGESGLLYSISVVASAP